MGEVLVHPQEPGQHRSTAGEVEVAMETEQKQPGLWEVLEPSY